MKVQAVSGFEKPNNLVKLLRSRNRAVSQESQVIISNFNEYLRHWLEPISREWDDPAARFTKLKLMWLEETMFVSSIDKMALHPAYQQIIGMGPVAVPLIMEELRTSPNHWFWALKSITGNDPVPLEKRGDVKAMAQEWLSWWTRCEARSEHVCATAVS
jgi:hypothetical protein